MRSFPSAPARRVALVLGMTVLASGLTALPSTTEPAHADWRDKLRATQEKIEDVKDGLDEASDRVQQATARLSTARNQLESARERLDSVKVRVSDAVERNQQLEEDLELSRERLVNARASVAAVESAVEETRDEAADTITSIYQSQGDPGLQAFSSFLSAGSLDELERQQQAESLIVDRQSSSYDAVQAAEKSLTDTRKEVADATDEVAQKQQAAEEQVAELRRLRDQATQARDHVIRMVDRSRDARQKASKAQARDRAALKRLRAQESEVRKKILAEARAASRAGTGYTGRVGSLLDYPAGGSVTSPFGYREHPIYHYWGLHDGTDFGVACGSPLRAVADGTVISRYYSSVYGNRLYLSLGNVNGKNLTAVYNHASSYGYGVGARVSRGTTLGYVGDTGWSTGCHLHFTILENGKAVDPMKYLG